MSHTFHCRLRHSLRWYHLWHSCPRHHQAHWALFVILSVFISSFISHSVWHFYLENDIALAQTVWRSPLQRSCPNGYINIGGANASGGDPAETPGWYCDDDQGIYSGVVEGSYPIQGILLCTDNTGVAFWADRWAWPCNAGRPPPNQGWDFSSGWPTKISGTAIPFRDTVNCPGSVDITLNNNDFTSGAWTQTPSTRGLICVPGILITPPPPLPNRFIYFIAPNPAIIGDTITIYGDNLDSNVQITDPGGTVTTYTGSVNTGGTEVRLTGLSLSPGVYLVMVGTTLPNLSDPIRLQIIPGILSPAPTGTEPPVIYGIDPTTVAQGETFEILGDFLAPTVQLFASSGTITNINGVISSDLKIVTVTIPANFPLGTYGVGVLTRNGSVLSTDFIIIVPGETQITATAGLTPPQATNFQDLITYVYDYSVILVGAAVFIMILWGGFLWLTSAANPGNIAKAKKVMLNAILGLILLLSAYIILNMINPDLVGNTLILPPIQTP